MATPYESNLRLQFLKPVVAELLAQAYVVSFL
ncbi:MAG: hypothetical protein ACI9WM_001661, partial [Arenicella sp.]